jgi:thiamine biosynthesis lipoprotein
MYRVLVPSEIASVHPPINCAVRDFSGNSMGTSWSVRFIDTSGCVGVDWRMSIQAQLDRVVAQMSHWEATSDLGRYNRAAACTWHELPEDFCIVMRAALHVAELSGGAYDPTAGALVDLWGFGPGSGFADADFVLPDASAITAALPECSWQRVRLEDNRLLQPGGVRLDFSAIAKGYGVDLVARHLHASGIDHFLVEVGGELRGTGMKPDGQPWWVGLELPPDAMALQTLVALHGLSVATSGDYRRCFVRDGHRYSHTLDPRTGMPLENAPASVTVLHADCMFADAWSTALTVLGVDAGLLLAERLQLAVCFVMRAENGCFVEHRSSRFSEMLQ